MDHGGCTKACLVGEHAAGNAHADGHHDGCSGKAALGGSRREGVLDNPQEDAGHTLDVGEDDDKGEDNVEEGHEGHELASHNAHALHAAYEHAKAYDKQGASHCPFTDAEGGLHVHGNGVGLHHAANAHDGGNDTEDGEEGAKPFPAGAKAVLDEVHAAAHVVAGRGFLPVEH